MTIPALVLLLKFSTLAMTSWKVNDSSSWHSLDMIFVAGRKQTQLPSYRKVISHLVVQVVHKVSMYLIQFSKWLSKQVFPSTIFERNHVQILIFHNSDLWHSALSSSTTSYALMSLARTRNSDFIEWSMVYWIVINKWRWVRYSSSSSSITELSGVSPSSSRITI